VARYEPHIRKTGHIDPNESRLSKNAIVMLAEWQTSAENQRKSGIQKRAAYWTRKRKT
jgi:hypothetical protein